MLRGRRRRRPGRGRTCLSLLALLVVTACAEEPSGEGTSSEPPDDSGLSEASSGCSGEATLWLTISVGTSELLAIDEDRGEIIELGGTSSEAHLGRVVDGSTWRLVAADVEGACLGSSAEEACDGAYLVWKADALPGVLDAETLTCSEHSEAEVVPAW